MPLSRRQFLTAMSAAVGAFALDPEGLLYVPERTYFDLGATPHLVELVHVNIGQLVAEAWEAVVGHSPEDTVFSTKTFAAALREVDARHDHAFTRAGALRLR